MDGPEDITLSEVSHTRRDNCCRISPREVERMGAGRMRWHRGGGGGEWRDVGLFF